MYSILRKARDQYPDLLVDHRSQIALQGQKEGGSHLGFHSQLEGPTFEGQHGATMVASSFREDQDTQLQEGEDIRAEGPPGTILNHCRGMVPWGSSLYPDLHSRAQNTLMLSLCSAQRPAQRQRSLSTHIQIHIPVFQQLLIGLLPTHVVLVQGVCHLCQSADGLFPPLAVDEDDPCEPAGQAECAHVQDLLLCNGHTAPWQYLHHHCKGTARAEQIVIYTQGLSRSWVTALCFRGCHA